MNVTATLLLILCFNFDNSIYFSWVGAIIFSLYIGYDCWKSQKYVKTVDNAIDSAIDVYLDIINLFLEILTIMINFKNRREKF